MTRREFFQRFVLGVSGVVLFPNLLEAFDEYPSSGIVAVISDSNEALLDEIAEVIIPTTNTPGAKAAKVGAFITLIMQDCYKPADRTKFYDNLANFEADCKATYGKSFMDITELERIEALKKAQSAHNIFFADMKQLTISGYFSSEIGCTQALEYLPVPGAWRACENMKPGQRAWAM